MSRYYRLDRTEGGPLPASVPHLKVGAIIRVPRKNSRKPGPVFNVETCEWVTPVWVECDDPREASA